jgi:hypothetical protein
MARRSPDQLLDALSAVHREPASAASAELLHAALASPPNVVVAKAARLIQEHRMAGHEPALCDAFFRFMQDPPRLDHGCDATTAIAHALLETEAVSDDAVRVYLAGVHHRQVDGPRGDSAGALRGYCGLGLLTARHRDAVVELTDLLADPEPAARVAGARGLGATGREDLGLLLRLKLRLRDDSSDVMFECMIGALRLDPARSVDLVAGFLHDEESDLPEAAALALGESRLAAALAPLRAAYDRARRADLRRAIVLAAAVLRKPEAVDWLMTLLASGPTAEAVSALDGLKLYRADATVEARVRAAVAARHSDAITKAFDQAWRG